MALYFPRTRRAALLEQPRLLDLERKLLDKAGESVALLPENDLDALLEHGRFVEPTTVTLVPGKLGRCHTNVARLWMHTDRLMRIFTGWALAGDGTWFQHSWGGGRRQLVETTEPRLLYFGIELSDEQAAVFWENEMRRAFER